MILQHQGRVGFVIMAESNYDKVAKADVTYENVLNAIQGIPWGDNETKKVNYPQLR